MNRACVPKEKHQNSQKWAKFMNFSSWPFLWFGLPGRLLILGVSSVFSCFSLFFSRIFTGVERGKKSLVFWVVFFLVFTLPEH